MLAAEYLQLHPPGIALPLQDTGQQSALAMIARLDLYLKIIAGNAESGVDALADYAGIRGEGGHARPAAAALPRHQAAGAAAAERGRQRLQHFRTGSVDVDTGRQRQRAEMRSQALEVLRGHGFQLSQLRHRGDPAARG